MGKLLAESLVALAREQPRQHARLCEQLQDRTVEVRVEAEHFLLRFAPEGARVERAGAPSEARVLMGRRALGDVLAARLSLAEAVLTDAVEVVGPLDTLMALHEGLVTYVHGAVRCPSFPSLLARCARCAARPSLSLMEVSRMPPETADGASAVSPASGLLKPPGRVHIYGAGIAGLTAAHELALRGFRVRVIDPAQDCDELGRLEGAPAPVALRMAVGGAARTQFRRVLKPLKEEPWRFHQLFLEYPPDFEPGQGMERVPAALQPELRDFLSRCGLTRSEPQGVLQILVPPSDDGERQRARRRNAEALHQFLTDGRAWELKLPPARVVILEPEEAAELATLLDDISLRPHDEEVFQLDVVHAQPGAHGTCFVLPSHRHLLATLGAIPLLDDDARPSGRWVADNLVTAGFHGIASQGRRIRFLRHATDAATGPAGKLQGLRELADTGYPPADSLQFTLRLWRYLCTCSERRRAEFEKLTWWEYLEGYDPEARTRRYQYSPAFKNDMQVMPRVLASFDADWGDARTNGNTLAQLYLDNLRPAPRENRVFNGPATLAWFRPWRRYLEAHLGVEFHAGALVRIERDPASGRLAVFWKKKGAEEETEDAEVETGTSAIEPVDYYLVATDAKTAERVTSSLPPVGVIHGLRGFFTTIPPNPRGPHPAEERSGEVLPGHVPWDRFQTLTSLQLFFPTPIRLAEGYLCFLDTPWGLSALSAHPYQAVPPTLDGNGFASVLSVDLRNWLLQGGQKSPSNSSRDGIAFEVWHQLKQAAELHGKPLPEAAQADFPLPEVDFSPEGTDYLLDRFITVAVDPDTGYERAFTNEAPVLVPIVNDWERRPGASPRDPLHPPPPATRPGVGLLSGVWQSPHGGYQVHWGKLVFAGAWMKTFTRTASMESANESARHAVNAIIDHHLARAAPEPEASPRIRPDVAGAPGAAGGAPVPPGFRMTPLGEYCRVWDPEKHELPELGPLRELDAKLFAAGKPHVWDMLHLEPLALPLLQHLDPPRGAESLLELLRQVRSGLEALLKAAAPGMKWPPL
ncbi:NAD(P)-binding protein [Pyxidicoccus sp. 3LG]